MKIANVFSLFILMLFVGFTSCSNQSEGIEDIVEEKEINANLFALEGNDISSSYEIQELKKLSIERLMEDPANKRSYESWNLLISNENIKVTEVKDHHYVTVEWIDDESQISHGLLTEIELGSNRGLIMAAASCRSSGCECTSRCHCLEPSIPGGYCEEFL